MLSNKVNLTTLYSFTPSFSASSTVNSTVANDMRLFSAGTGAQTNFHWTLDKHWAIVNISKFIRWNMSNSWYAQIQKANELDLLSGFVKWFSVVQTSFLKWIFLTCWNRRFRIRNTIFFISSIIWVFFFNFWRRLQTFRKKLY